MDALFLYLEDDNMRIIKTLRDVELLKEKSQINKEVLAEIEEYFKSINNSDILYKNDPDYFLMSYILLIFVQLGF